MNSDRKILDCFRLVTAFNSYDELTTSIRKHGYVPTLRPESFNGDDESRLRRAVEGCRRVLIADGLPVYPAAGTYPSDEQTFDDIAAEQLAEMGAVVAVSSVVDLVGQRETLSGWWYREHFLGPESRPLDALRYLRHLKGY